MMRIRTAVVTAVLVLLSVSAFAAKTTYVTTNHRFDWVKLKEVSSQVAGERQMTHPVTIDEQGLRAALASIQLSRSFVIKKEVDTQRVFDDDTVNALAGAMAKAFSMATDRDEVVFSSLNKNPLFILRNDRLNLGQAWVHENELHIKFDKLYAKLIGDTDKRGNEAKIIAKAQGLRISLELGAGQKLGITDPEELVLDLNYNYVKKPEEEKKAEGVTMSGQKAEPGLQPGEAAPPAEAAADKGKEASEKATKGSKKKGKAEAAAPVETPPPAPVKSAKDRLQELETLKKDGLINKQEYQQKKQEILKDL